MGLIALIVFWRVYILVSAFLILNSISTVVFNPNKEQLKEIAKSLPFIIFWPLSAFSPKGRKYLVLKTKEI